MNHTESLSGDPQSTIVHRSIVDLALAHRGRKHHADALAPANSYM